MNLHYVVFIPFIRFVDNRRNTEYLELFFMTQKNYISNAGE